MSNIVSMAGKQSASSMEPNAGIIEALEQILEEAKAGRIQHFAAAYTDGKAPPSDLYMGSGEPAHVMMLIGGLEMCKHTMLMTQYQASAVFVK